MKYISSSVTNILSAVLNYTIELTESLSIHIKTNAIKVLFFADFWYCCKILSIIKVSTAAVQLIFLAKVSLFIIAMVYFKIFSPRD